MVTGNERLNRMSVDILEFPDFTGALTRFSHGLSTAAADPGMSTALCSVGFLDVLSSTPAESSRRAPCIHARLRRLATKPREKSGFMPGIRPFGHENVKQN